MKLGIYGGTFNPVHLGHVHLLREVRRLTDLDKILVMPDRLPPHKAGLPLIKETACRADGQKHSPQREEAVEEPVFQQNTVDIIQDVKNKCQTGADQEKHIPPAFKRV